MNESKFEYEELQIKNEAENVEEDEKINHFTIKDLLYNLFSIAIAFLALKMLISGAGGIWVTLLTVLVCTGIFIYGKVQKIEMTKSSYLCLLYNLLLGLSFSIFENTIFLEVNLLFLVLSGGYWVLSLGDARVTKKLDNHVLYDVFMGIFIRPFKHFIESFSVYSITAINKKSKNAGYILLGLIISIPLLAVVIALLSSADALFGKWMYNITLQLSINLKENIIVFLFSLPLGYYLFLYVYRNMIHFDKTEKIKRQLKGPDALFITILSVFIFIYLVFFVSTILSFLSFLKDPITASSVSEYARTGFFQLSIVSLINVGIFSLVKIIGNEKSKPILVLLSCIGVETLGLIFLGFAKMQLYISKFGLTIMRYNTSAFMLILFLCVCLFIAALWKPFNYIRVTVLVIALSILGISYQNAGGFIASRNYEKYQQKTLYDFDLSVFYDIGADAVPAALRAYQETDDKELKAELEEYLHYMEFELTEEAPNKINYSKEKAKILLKKYDNKEEK